MFFLKFLRAKSWLSKAHRASYSLVAGSLLALTPAGPGFFSLKKQGGVWWLSGPSHARMWSLGVDCTEIGDAGKPGNPNYDGRKLFGSVSAWAADTLAKYKAWGVNTLGGWSDVADFGGAMPYAEVLHLGAYDMAPWHDLYSKKTEDLLAKAAANLVPQHADDPMLIGYFTDNELGWWDDTLFLSYFAFPKDSPGKIKLVEVLEQFYSHDFSKLTKDWDTSATGFGSLLSETKIAMKPGSNGIKAVHAFVYALSSHYYKLVHDLIRKYDRKHLILGDRYCQYYNLETARAAGPYVDVVSSNAGADWLDGTYSHSYFDNLHRITGKPLMVTEFYFSARENQTGNGNSGSAFPLVDTQVERARGFASCLNELASLPYMVGAHWFQQHDEPPKGRGDGEDWNFGLVDIYGRPYPLMIEALQHFHADEVHLSKAAAVSGVPRAPAEPMKDHLLYWDRKQGYVRSGSALQWADLYVTYDADNLYLGLVPMEYADGNLYAGGQMPAVDWPRFQVQIGGWKGEVRYSDKEKAQPSAGIAEVAERNGLKHVLTMRIPRETLGLGHLESGMKIALKATLESHGRGYQMTWDQKLLLR